MEQHTDVIITSTPREGNPVAASDRVISGPTGVAEEGSQIKELNKNKVTTDHGQSPESHKKQEAEKDQHPNERKITNKSSQETKHKSELLTTSTMDEVNNDNTMRTSESKAQSKEPSTRAMNSENIFIPPTLGLKTVLEHQEQTNEPHPSPLGASEPSISKTNNPETHKTTNLTPVSYTHLTLPTKA